MSNSELIEHIGVKPRQVGHDQIGSLDTENDVAKDAPLIDHAICPLNAISDLF